MFVKSRVTLVIQLKLKSLLNYSNLPWRVCVFIRIRTSNQSGWRFCILIRRSTIVGGFVSGAMWRILLNKLRQSPSTCTSRYVHYYDALKIMKIFPTLTWFTSIQFDFPCRYGFYRQSFYWIQTFYL